MNQYNHIVFDEADKTVNLGFEDYVNRTLLAIPNTNVKVSSEDVSTFIQPQKDSTAFRKLNIDHNDDEDKGHWTEETLEQMNTRDWSFAGGLLSFIPSGRVPNPMQV